MGIITAIGWLYVAVSYAVVLYFVINLIKKREFPEKIKSMKNEALLVVGMVVAAPIILLIVGLTKCAELLEGW